jgi:hypothetical protein
MDIDIIGETEQSVQYWSARNAQMDEDRRIIAMQYPEKMTSKQQYFISNEAKVFYDTAVALVSSFPARFRMPLSINYEASEKDKISKSERFLTAIFRQLDRRQLAKGNAYWMRELAYWTMSGWYAVFCHVQKRGKDVEFIADFYDPMTVYPAWDSDGLFRCIRTFEVDVVTALTLVERLEATYGKLPEFKLPDQNKMVKIINYWRRDFDGDNPVVRNAILVNGQEVKKLTVEKFDHIPIHVGAVGSPDKYLSDWQTRTGESIIAANREMYYTTDSILSLMKTILSETAYPNILTKTSSGAPAVNADDVKGYGQVIPLRLQDQLELLSHASTPKEGFELLSYMLRQVSKGSFPDVVYGGMQLEISGFALSQLLAAIRYKVGPYWNTMQNVMSNIATDFLMQYKNGKFPKVSLPTVNPQAMRRGLIYVEDYEPSDVPDNSYVEVSIPITSSLDKTQQLIQARQALTAPQLLSRETLWDDFLEVQDSEQEYARIIQDEILEEPFVKQLAALEQLRKRADAFQTNGQTQEAQALRRHIMMIEMSLGMRQGIPSTLGQPGISPSTMPPEMLNSPDQNRAAAGIPPQGLNRPAQTPMQREQSLGRKGILVSPSGEAL